MLGSDPNKRVLVLWSFCGIPVTTVCAVPRGVLLFEIRKDKKRREKNIGEF